MGRFRRFRSGACSRSARRAIRSPPMAPTPPPIPVNRGPVLTLWTTVVAEWLGYLPETALTLGRFVAGSCARAKARRLESWTRRRKCRTAPDHRRRLPEDSRRDDFVVRVRLLPQSPQCGGCRISRARPIGRGDHRRSDAGGGGADRKADVGGTVTCLRSAQPAI
jgi:hypothetical protein